MCKDVDKCCKNKDKNCNCDKNVSLITYRIMCIVCILVGFAFGFSMGSSS